VPEDRLALGAFAAVPQQRPCRLLDDSPNRHATKHFNATGHPIIEGYDPPEGWGWCYVDAEFVKLPSTMPQRGPIPRWV
jgi:Zn-finger in ubiquitin-hydrolases and other protein